MMIEGGEICVLWSDVKMRHAASYRTKTQVKKQRSKD